MHLINIPKLTNIRGRKLFFLTVMKAASEIRYCIFEIRTGPKNGTFKEQEKTPELKNVTDASLQRLGG